MRFMTFTTVDGSSRVSNFLEVHWEWMGYGVEINEIIQTLNLSILM